MRKRLMSLLLAFSMLLSMLPVPSMAAETDWDVEPEESPAVDADVILPVGAPEEDGNCPSSVWKNWGETRITSILTRRLFR